MINKRKELLLLILIILLGGIIRFYKLSSVPPALHGDELGIGYNAYSLIRTGKDEYGFVFPFVFRNDFSPLIHYLTIPSVFLLGLNELGTRLPIAVIGILSIIAVYYLITACFKNTKLALLTSYFVSTSSWHIRTSRIAVEMTLALFFQITATWIFITAMKTKKKFFLLLLSFFLFSLSIVSYQSAKLTTPFLVVFLLFLYRNKILKKRLNRLVCLLLFFQFIIFPILLYFYFRPFSEMRFVGISVFTLWKSTFPSNSNLLTYLSPVAIFGLFKLIIRNYFMHFHPTILFLDNSMLRYYQLNGLGLFYPWESLFIIIGLLSTLKGVRKPENLLILFWLFISPLAAAFTTGVPYANAGRALMMLPILTIFTTKGLLITLTKSGPMAFLVRFCILVTVFISFIMFNKQYFIDMPKTYADFWGVPFKNAVKAVIPLEQSVDKIIFTTLPTPQSYMYVLFYGKKDPQWFLQNRGDRAKIVGYSSFGKYEFRPINWEKDKDIPNALLVGTAEEIPLNRGENLSLITTINEVRLKIYKTNN